jgi:hypothetical protein
VSFGVFHLVGVRLALDRREDAKEDPSFEGRVAMTAVSGRAAQGRAISQKEIERPRAWAPPARRSENDFALERGETFTDRWLRLRAAGLGDEVWDRRHARGARGSVETLQKLVYVACAMTRLVRARATPRADSSASRRDVGRVEGVRVDPLSMTVSRGSLTIGSRLSRIERARQSLEHARSMRPACVARQAQQQASAGLVPIARCESRARTSEARRTARTRSKCRARDRRNAEAHCRREPAALESRGKCGSEWTERG